MGFVGDEWRGGGVKGARERGGVRSVCVSRGGGGVLKVHPLTGNKLPVKSAFMSVMNAGS